VHEIFQIISHFACLTFRVAFDHKKLLIKD